MKKRQKTNKQEVINKLKDGSINLKNVPECYAEDFQVCLEAVKANIFDIDHLPESLEGNVEIALEAVSRNGMALSLYEHDGITSNYDVCMKAVMQNGMAYEHMFYSLQEDHDLALAAVKQNGLVLRIVSDCFEDDREINLAAVRQNGLAIQWVFQDFVEEKEFALTAVRQNGMALVHFEDIFDSDFDVVNAAVQQNGLALSFASDGLKDNFHIVANAVTKVDRLSCDDFKTPLMFASSRLQDDETLVRLAVQASGTAIRCASERLLLSRNICELALEQNPCSLFVFHDNMKNDRKMVRKAIMQAYMRCTNKYDFFEMRHSLLYMASTRLIENTRAIRYIMRGEYMVSLMPFPDVVGYKIFEYLE